MKLLVGLGNPGRKYEATRHNVGFRVVEQWAATHGATGWAARFDGLATEVTVNGTRTFVLKPQTYMNLSGGPVRKAVDFYKIDLADVLVVCDDLALPVGRLRLRQRGTSGGQKGLKDVMQHLGTEEVARLRLGIGAAGPAGAVDYVLSTFSAQERPLVDDGVLRATQAVECWCRSGIATAMNQYNGEQKVKE